MASQYSNNPIFQQIVQTARGSGSDPLTLAATAIVESGLNPRAVGDNGTSFGLFQHHIGGAGGSTKESAQSFFDATKSISERARAFKGGSGGAFAASVQRPADPAGYASKVDRVIEQLRGGADLTEVAGRRTPSQKQPSNRIASSRLDAFEFLLKDEPELLAQIKRKAVETPAEASPVDFSISTSGEGAGAQGASGGFEGFRDLQAFMQDSFGLLNDPGDGQTTGGSHSDGSLHYDGRAVDFGDARNSRETIMSAMDWARQNAHLFKEAYFNPAGFGIKNGKVVEGMTVPGHDDHVHFGV